MLLEIEQKVSYLSELSVHSESLLLEGRAETKGEAEQLTVKLRSLKDSLVELQQMLQDKQVDIQVRSLILFNSSSFLPYVWTLHEESVNILSIPLLGFSSLSLTLVALCYVVCHSVTISMVVLFKQQRSCRSHIEKSSGFHIVPQKKSYLLTWSL